MSSSHRNRHANFTVHPQSRRDGTLEASSFALHAASSDKAFSMPAEVQDYALASPPRSK